MKTLSANTVTAVDNPQTEPILLCKIELTSPSSLTLYHCSRPFDTRNTYDSNVYDPVLLSWSVVRAGEVNPVTYATKSGTVTLQFMNDVPIGGYDSLSRILAAFDYANAMLTLTQIHANAADAGDGVDLFQGRIENIESMDRAQVTLIVSDIGLSYMKKWPHTIVDLTVYPGADEDEVGKMLPQAWGTCKRVPFIAVDAGGVTTLAADLNSSSTTIQATDTTPYPSSGTIQIDVETMTYTAKTETSFDSVNRGTGGSTSVAHDLGTQIGEVQDEYNYIMGHPVKAITNVYIKDVLIPSTAFYIAYTGQAGDQHPTYGGNACVSFTAKPFLLNQTNLNINDQITVNDTAGVSDTIAVIDGISIVDTADVSDTITVSGASSVSDNIDFNAGSGSASMLVYPSSSKQQAGSVSNPNDCTDGNADTFALIDNVNDTMRVSFGVSTVPPFETPPVCVAAPPFDALPLFATPPV